MSTNKVYNKTMGETILVTGATGTVGSEVVKQLLSAKVERGYEDMIVKADCTFS